MKDRQAVTLIEAMLASTLLLITVFAFSSGFRLGLNTARHVRDQAAIEGLVRELLARLELDGFQAGGRRGTLEPLRPDVSYQLELSPGEIPTLKKVRLILRGEALPGGQVILETAMGDRRARKRESGRGPR